MQVPRAPAAKEVVAVIVVGLLILVALLLAYRYGTDSRDGRDWTPQPPTRWQASRTTPGCC